MDIATVFGLIVGWALTILSIVVGGNALAAYVDLPSIILVVFGGFCAVIISFPITVLTSIPRVVLKTVFAKPQNPAELIKKLVSYAEIARRDGILSLESMTSEMGDPFIVRAIGMAVDGTDPELIESILESEVENETARHQQGKSMLDAYAKYAPAFGMIGTLLGLVAMLQNMDDPSKIGPGMAVALLTTLYGALISNLVCLPMSDKLALRAGEEAFIKQIIIRGVMSIQQGDNPRIVEQKLLTFIPPSSRPAADENRKAA
ncbi:MAG: motility protein A [Phycisphaerales bacterium]|nr:motility protein A [Phycisphaerales bacterium]